MSNFAIDIRELCKSYDNHHVLKYVNLQVESGTVFALLGPNGAGKTTLLRIATTLLRPDSGTILIEGISPIEHPDKVKQLIGIVGQYASIDEKLTGLENLKMIGKLYHFSSKEANNIAVKLLNFFKLSSESNRLVSQYSGGMRRRLDLAASLVAQPKVLFLDEPTTGLDLHSRELLWNIIRELSCKGVTVFLTTQYLEEADKIADKVAIIHKGKITACDTVSYLKSQIGEEYFSIKVHNKCDIQNVQNIFLNMKIFIDIKAKTINFPIFNNIEGIHNLKYIIDTLLENNISIDKYNIHRPTLDDVFMSFTKM